jgi:hypothetical protein
MRKIAVFVLHALIAMLASVALGGVLSGIVSLMLSPVGPRHWVLFRLTTDGPYSPFFWGTGVLLGFFVNRRMRNASAQWVWVAGICWLSVWIWDAVRTYDPRWCQDCSVLQNVWRKLFTVGYNSCMQDCLGEVYGTTPMVTSIAYSLGAFFGLRSPATLVRTDADPKPAKTDPAS